MDNTTTALAGKKHIILAMQGQRGKSYWFKQG
jgi:hypothetical protein